MALLPTTAISTTIVQSALGSTSHNLRELCTHVNVNPWSRYKPGYLESDGSADKFITYQPPRGGAFTDPRGTNPDSASSLEGYRLGDFRAYNHLATAPYAQFPSATIEFGSSTSTSFGISVTFYAEEVNWSNTGVYRETNNWPEFTHVHILDASDDSIEGTAAIPAIGGSVSLSVDGVAMTAGVPVTKTYHIAFGVDSTHWSIKLGTFSGAIGIGNITVLRLLPATIAGAQFIDTSFLEDGTTSPVYTSCEITGTENYAITGTDTATFRFVSLDAFRCYYSGGSNYFKNIAATWYVKGFHESPTTEYRYKDGNIASNNAANTVDLGGAWVDTPPHSTWEDGDNITLVLRDLTINF